MNAAAIIRALLILNEEAEEIHLQIRQVEFAPPRDRFRADFRGALGHPIFDPVGGEICLAGFGVTAESAMERLGELCEQFYPGPLEQVGREACADLRDPPDTGCTPMDGDLL